MKYTKRQRHRIYKKALNEHRLGGFLCHAIDYAADYPEPGFQINLYPEFQLFKPYGKSDNDAWFTEYYTDETFKHQKTILEFCIEMTR